MTRGPRILIATVVTLVLMPCMGFFVIGFLHSYESAPEVRWPWQIAYLLFELVSLALVVLAWRFALKRVPSYGGTCLTCGFSLRSNTTGICPECGQAI